MVSSSTHTEPPEEPRGKLPLERWCVLRMGYTLTDYNNTQSECGKLQVPACMHVCPVSEKPCTELDLFNGNDKAIQTALFGCTRFDNVELD